MPARRAWFQIASVYRQQENTRYVYEEMVYTMREMQRGTPESECYEHFGMRCGLPVYRKFAVMLSQNLRKGTRDWQNYFREKRRERLKSEKQQPENWEKRPVPDCWDRCF